MPADPRFSPSIAVRYGPTSTVKLAWCESTTLKPRGTRSFTPATAIALGAACTMAGSFVVRGLGPDLAEEQAGVVDDGGGHVGAVRDLAERVRGQGDTR